MLTQFAHVWRRLVVAALLLALLVAAESAPAAAQQPPCASPWPTINLVQVAQGINQPLYVTHAGDGSGRLFIVSKAGTIHVFKNGALLPTPFLDLSALVSTCPECGLLGLAFPDDYEQSGAFIVSYTGNVNRVGPLPDQDNDNVIARYRVSGNPDVALQIEETILEINQPYQNHNGGMITFGPDGMLYVAIGDGGSGNDPQNQAQDKNSLLGKMLRLEVGPTGTYTIPAGNPFAGPVAGRDEIWSYGLRNPWRFSFDRQSGDLWIADVGQGAREEINFEPVGTPGGRNYGWKIMEGSICRPGGDPNCSTAGLTLPVWDYGREEGNSTTGGYVYRGSAYPAMSGIYFYGDYGSGNIWGLRRLTGGWENRELESGRSGLVSFGEDEAGELYVTDIGGGKVYRVQAGAPEPAFCAYLPNVRRSTDDN